MPPRKYQLSRGTCWDFGTIGVLEHLYRIQGISTGMFDNSSFTQFSEQAFGASIILLCQANIQKCLLPADRVAFNSTEGGEAILLNTFSKELKSSILPISICPYIPSPQPGNETFCPGMNAAISTNPISFTLDSFTTLYDISHIKSSLIASGHSMPFTTAVHTVSYYGRCDDDYFRNNTMCSLSPCIPCPDYFNFKCCVKITAPMYNMNGEFRKHHTLELEAGHVMVLVGFNDEYQTEDGMKGGFIMRNSWRDGVYSLDEFGERKARGSHSIAYFMQKISPSNERAICPNSNNPRNWYTCGSGFILMT